MRVIFDKTLANTLFNYIDGKLFWKERKDAHFKKGNEISLRELYEEFAVLNIIGG